MSVLEERAAELIRDLLTEFQSLRQNDRRYRWLRSRNLDAISEGGVFAGMTPKNVVLNGDDLDAAIDSECLCPFCHGKRRCAICGDTGDVPHLARVANPPDRTP